MLGGLQRVGSPQPGTTQHTEVVRDLTECRRVRVWWWCVGYSSDGGGGGVLETVVVVKMVL